MDSDATSSSTICVPALHPSRKRRHPPPTILSAPWQAAQKHAKEALQRWRLEIEFEGGAASLQEAFHDAAASGQVEVRVTRRTQSTWCRVPTPLARRSVAPRCVRTEAGGV